MVNKSKLGHCYKENWTYAVINKYTLIHGYISNSFPPFQTIDHAWCMKDNIVYDAIMEKHFTWQNYKRDFKAEIEKEYTPREAINLAEKTGLYYWHKGRELNLDKYYENGKLKKEFIK